MTYKVLSRKWRPQQFEEVVGQIHVTKTLQNAIRLDRIGHGYLFTGPRGVGKTTVARIFSKVINCKNPINYTSCSECINCTEITNGSSMDVLELDGASNRGIDEIRDLRESIKYPPNSGKFRIYIIDEVHMLTNQAFNALLRTLEEPPEHGKFILATTDIHKVPSTIISRCQRFDFNRITSSVILKRLSEILEDENISSDQESLLAISRKADGSMRDALSLLDQVISYSGDSFKIEQISSLIGLIPSEMYFNFSNALLEKDYSQMLGVISSIRNKGLSLEDFNEGLIEHFNNLMVSKVSEGDELLDLNKDTKSDYINNSKMWISKDIIRISKVLHDIYYSLKNVKHPMIFFEMTAMKLMEMDSSVSISELISGSRELSQKKKHEDSQSLKNNSDEAIKNNQDISKSDLEDSESLNNNSDKEIKNNDKISKPDSEDFKSVISDKVLDLENIKSNWSDFVGMITKKRPSIGTILDSSIPIELVGNNLNIDIMDLSDFSVANLERHSSLINQFAENYFNSPVKIFPKLVVSKKKENVSKKSSKENEDNIVTNDNVLSKVIEVFDGELLR